MVCAVFLSSFISFANVAAFNDGVVADAVTATLFAVIVIAIDAVAPFIVIATAADATSPFAAAATSTGACFLI